MNIFKIRDLVENTIAVTGLGGALIAIPALVILFIQCMFLNLVGWGANISPLIYTSVIQQANLQFPWTIPLFVCVVVGGLGVITAALLVDHVRPGIKELVHKELDKYES
jgi:H+/Cl- antiporter ClcA